MHNYHHLGDKLSRHPVGAPKTEEFIEILKILFKPDEIEVATHLEFIPRTASDIASETGLSPGEVSIKLESLANRGAVLAKSKNGDTYYSLLPNYPGLFEYPLMKGLNPQEEKRLAELWHAYYMQDMAVELASARPPWIRVFPAEDALTANEEIEIIPYDKASELMKKAESIALARCPCRVIGKNCDKPLDVCLSFDGAARFLAERGMARIITRTEALQVLRESEEAGLVHTGSNITERLYFMCNCCSCCCHMLMLLTKHGFKEGIARSAYRAELDQAECSGCAICVEERCPVGALTMDTDGLLAILDIERCIGCGLCISTCPGEALKLVTRESYEPPPASAGELVEQVIINKIKKT